MSTEKQLTDAGTLDIEEGKELGHKSAGEHSIRSASPEIESTQETINSMVLDGGGDDLVIIDDGGAVASDRQRAISAMIHEMAMLATAKQEKSETETANPPTLNTGITATDVTAELPSIACTAVEREIPMTAPAFSDTASTTTTSETSDTSSNSSNSSEETSSQSSDDEDSTTEYTMSSSNTTGIEVDSDQSTEPQSSASSQYSMIKSYVEGNTDSEYTIAKQADDKKSAEMRNQIDTAKVQFYMKCFISRYCWYLITSHDSIRGHQNC
ncbi:unnamed protein product [Gongylonema pulchrum]|uniref:Dentin sialophosphoprotein-like n=1 Tax=Gongylonema pulchrum TaxID=637853 RepID=A0A183DLL7_9BILA|nr:unnamed protein product [Gongylonema pulchrum]